MELSGQFIRKNSGEIVLIMGNSVSKLVGKLLQLTGVIIVLWGIVTKNPAGGIGVLVGLVGRAIDEYWDEWFG